MHAWPFDTWSSRSSAKKKERKKPRFPRPPSARRPARCEWLEAEDTQIFSPNAMQQGLACNIIADIGESRIKVTLLYPYFLVQWWEEKGKKKKKNERKRKGSIRESRGCFSGRAHKSKRKALGSIPNRKLNDITRFYVIIQFSFFFLFFFPPLVSLSSHGLCHADACISPVRSSVSIARSPFDFSSLLNGLEKTRKQRASR